MDNPLTGLVTAFDAERDRIESTHASRVTAAERIRELNRLPKAILAQMHASNGGLMSLATYMQWRKDELVTAILEDEGLNPWN